VKESNYSVTTNRVSRRSKHARMLTYT